MNSGIGVSTIKDLLLIQSFSLEQLIESYRVFFLGLLPGIFILSVLIEYFDRLEPFSLIKRVLISVLILTSVTHFYHASINTSFEAADEVLMNQKQGNILLMDMLGGIKHWDKLQDDMDNKSFYKDKSLLGGTFSFFKYHLFDSFINNGFTVSIYFLTKLCFLLLKVVYSLVYYLGYGLVGIPCLIYLFPSMGNVLRGAILSYIWCLVIPHILVFLISMLGSEINKGYVAGQVIGGSMTGTALLFILALFVAFTPLIGSMILTGAGASGAAGVIASLGANKIMALPRNLMNSSATLMSGGSLGPKMQLAKAATAGSFQLASKAKDSIRPNFNNSKNNQNLGGKNMTNLKENSQSTGERITDMQHISSFIKEASMPLATNKDLSIAGTQSLKNKKIKNVGDYKFKIPDFPNYSKSSESLKSNQNQSRSNLGEKSDEKISKYSRSNTGTQKTLPTNRSFKRTSKPSHSRNRNTDKP